MNRWVEFFLALIILIVLSPVFITIAILIFLTDVQSPFFISKRVGQYGNEFNMYNFDLFFKLNYRHIFQSLF